MTPSFAPWDQQTDANKALYAYYTEEDGDDSGSRYAPGGSFSTRYADIADVVAGTTQVTQGFFNQKSQNINSMRLGQFMAGSIGLRFDVCMVNGSPKAVLLAKEMTNPEVITYDNADFAADFTPKPPGTIGF